jgi:hypothetical protein
MRTTPPITADPMTTATVRSSVTRSRTADSATVPSWSLVKKRESIEFARLSPSRNNRPSGTVTSYVLCTPSTSPCFT